MFITYKTWIFMALLKTPPSLVSENLAVSPVPSAAGYGLRITSGEGTVNVTAEDLMDLAQVIRGCLPKKIKAETPENSEESKPETTESSEAVKESKPPKQDKGGKPALE